MIATRHPNNDLIGAALKIIIACAIAAIAALCFCSCSRNVTKSIQKTDSTTVHQVAKVLDSSKAAVRVKKRNNTTHFTKRTTTVTTPILIEVGDNTELLPYPKNNNYNDFLYGNLAVDSLIEPNYTLANNNSDHTGNDYLPTIHRGGKKYIVANQTKKVEVYTGGAHSVTTDSSNHSNNFHQAETTKDSTHLTKIDKSKNVKSHPSVWWWLLLIPIGYLVRRYWPKIKAILFA